MRTSSSCHLDHTLNVAWCHIVVVSFRPPCDRHMCPSSPKQVRDMWPLIELPCRSLWSIQTPSRSET